MTATPTNLSCVSLEQLQNMTAVELLGRGHLENDSRQANGPFMFLLSRKPQHSSQNLPNVRPTLPDGMIVTPLSANISGANGARLMYGDERRFPVLNRGAEGDDKSARAGQA